MKDASDDTAFYHSVAGYGLKFRLGDTALQLARRSDKKKASEALGALCHGCRLPVRSPSEARIQAEGLLLRAVAEDDADAVLRVLEGDVPPSVLLNLRVKETFGAESDDEAFFSSVASHGLSYEIGDGAEELATRSGRLRAVRALRAKADLDRTVRRSTEAGEPAADRPLAAPATLHVLLRGVGGELLAELDVDGSGRVGDLAAQLSRLAPPPEGCVRRELLLGEVILDPDLPLASYFQEEGQTVHLDALNVAGGAFTASIPAPRWLQGPRRGRGGHTTIILNLMREGEVGFSHTEHPIDTGHCAGAAGGRLVKASGTWCTTSSGVRVVLAAGTDATMSHGSWGERRSVQLQQRFMFGREEDALVALEAPAPAHLSSRLAVRIAPGTRFDRFPQGQP